MPLDPQMKMLIDAQKAMNLPPINTLPAQVVRQGSLEYSKQIQQLAGPPTPVANVTDRTIPGPASDLPIRIYTPPGISPFPTLVFLHGGGWVIGSIEAYDGICRLLCVGAGCLVVSVEYRLAPEYKFPAATDDCLAAVRWVGEHAAEIGGDSTHGLRLVATARAAICRQ